MKIKLALLLVSVLLLPQCGNVINELIPREAEDDPLPPKTCTVTFNKNGADTDAVPANNTAAYGGTVSLPITNPAWTDHAFEGWWTENGSGGNWGSKFTASTPVTADITVYARWDPPPVYYTVWFNHNNTDPGSTGANPAVMQTAAGTTVSPMPIPPTRPGYVFGSWHTSPDGGATLGPEFTVSTVVTANISVYARWDPPPNYHTVTFNKNNTDSGSTEANPRTAAVADGGTVNPLPTPPTRPGYTFGGWYESADGGATLGAGFSAATTVTADITVYAWWATGSLNIVYTDGSAETIPVDGTSYTLPVNNKTFYSFTFSAPGFPTDPILIGRLADGSPVTLAFNLTSPYALKLQAPKDSGPFTGYIPINTYDEFQLINTSTATLGGHYVQEADLDLLGFPTGTGGPQPAWQEWTRIGGYDQATAFTGTYDGNHKNITNLYINKTGTGYAVDSYQGLFGYLTGIGCEVKNVSILFSSVTGYQYVGGLAGWNDGAAITDCSNAGSVTGYYHIGGLAGYNGGATITGCSNVGTVTGYSLHIGGLVGFTAGGTIKACYNTGAISGDYAGGLVGYFNGGTITNCYNTGNVTHNRGSGDDNGGLVGLNNGTITACYNTGSVSGGDYTGGLVGLNNDTITACYNTGNVSGRVYVGGLAGKNDGGAITACYNTGAATGYQEVGGLAGKNDGGAITACYNTGAVTGNTYVGGLAGKNDGGAITACYNTGAVTGNTYVGGLMGLVSSGIITDCYWRDITASAYKGTGSGTATWNLSTYSFSLGAFTGPALEPTPTMLPATGGHAAWAIGNNPSAGLYWKSGYTGPNANSEMYPALGWEP